MKLSTSQWINAKSYIYSHARPLEQYLFAFLFEGSHIDKAVEELSRYQNSDGGFGHSIEPDFRLEDSSPLATTIGLQYAKELNLSKDHTIIRDALTYLNHCYDEGINGWHAVPIEVNHVPHAPWWHFDEEKGHCGVQTTWANPNAEIVGYFHLYQPDHPRLKEWTERALIELKKLPFPIEMHDFLCYQRLEQMISGASKEQILQQLSSSVRDTVCIDPNRWNEYVAKPLQIVNAPSSPFYKKFEKEVQLQLDAEIKSQNEKGYWEPNWSWFGHYEDTWNKAKIEWRGILTLQMLKTLKAFNKVDI